MIVEIHTVAVEGPSRGKSQTARIWDLGAAIKLHAPYKGKIGSIPWALTIAGSSIDQSGTGSRGGKVVEFKSEVLIELSPKDVCEIVAFAVQHGLVQVAPNMTLSPAS